jgi:hypothetical protein
MNDPNHQNFAYYRWMIPSSIKCSDSAVLTPQTAVDVCLRAILKEQKPNLCPERAKLLEVMDASVLPGERTTKNTSGRSMRLQQFPETIEQNWVMSALAEREQI